MTNPVGVALAMIAVWATLLLLLEVSPMRRLARLVVLVVPGVALAYTVSVTGPTPPQGPLPPADGVVDPSARRHDVPAVEAPRNAEPRQVASTADRRLEEPDQGSAAERPAPTSSPTAEASPAPGSAGPRLPPAAPSVPAVSPSAPLASSPPVPPEPVTEPTLPPAPAVISPPTGEPKPTTAPEAPAPALPAQDRPPTTLAAELEARQRLELELRREQAAHALTRAAFESKAAALQKALSANSQSKAGPLPPAAVAPRATGKPDAAEGAGPTVTVPQAAAKAPSPPPSPAEAAVPINPTPSAASEPTARPEPAPKAVPSPPPQATASGIAALRQQMEAGGMVASATVRRLPSGELVAGRGGAYYAVTLLNPATGKPFRFVAERYILADKDADLAGAFQKLIETVAAPLPAGAVALYVQANAGNRPLTGPRNLSAARSGLARVAYLPRRAGDDGFWAKPLEQTVQGTFQHGDLPVLRAGNVREILARAPGADRVGIEVLAGRLLDPGDEAANTFDLILCVRWPG